MENIKINRIGSVKASTMFKSMGTTSFHYFFGFFVISAALAISVAESDDPSLLEREAIDVGNEQHDGLIEKLVQLFKKMLGIIGGGTKHNIRLESHVEGPSLNFKGPSMDFKLEVLGAGDVDTKTSEKPLSTPGATETTTHIIAKVTSPEQTAATVEVITSQPHTTTQINLGTTTTPHVETTKGQVRYTAVKKVMTWSEARDNCFKLGGELATPTNEFELKEFSRVQEEARLDVYVWIGLSFSGSGAVTNKNSWVDLCDKTPSLDPWYPGSPNDDNRHRNYNCGVAYRTKWANSDCSFNQHSICQFAKSC